MVTFTVALRNFKGEIQPSYRNQSEYECGNVPHADFAHLQVGHMNSVINQQKAAWFERELCVSCAFYIATLLTIDNGP